MYWRFRELILTFLAALVWLGATTADGQENWTRFRGPNGTGLAEQADLPVEISDSNYLWKIELPGIGSSSPVIWGDKVFITSCDSKTAELTLQCLDAATGNEGWSKSFQSKPYKLHDRNSFASSTPAVDKDHVYFTYANPEQTMLVAVDHSGQQKWERDLGTWISQHGFGASPIVYDDKLILFHSQQADRVKASQNPGDSQVIALNCQDGSDVWKASLTATRACYSVPSVFQDASGKKHLVSCNTGDGFFSIDPETGKKNWSLLPFRMRTVASTLIADGLIIGSSGSGGGGNYLVAIRPDGSGVNSPEKAYEVQRANYVSSPIAVDGKLFIFTDKGICRCVELQTGKTLWEERMSRGFSSSPVATDSHIYVTDEQGKLFVIAVSDKYQEVATHSLGEPTRSSPAIVNNRLYLRTDSHLICVGKK